MFCPNCGTQNDESAQTCAKCSFALKGAAAPKFKGTMLMMNQPGAGGPTPPRPAAVPPSAPGPAAPAAPPAGGAPAPGATGAAQAPSRLKGTIVGVAPPNAAAGGAAAGASPYGAPGAPAPGAPAPGAPAAPSGDRQSFGSAADVNPLGGTMAFDGSGMPPFAPGAPGAPGDPLGAPPAGAPGAPPPGDAFGAPGAGAPGAPPPGDALGAPGAPPPGDAFGTPPPGGIAPAYGAPPAPAGGGYGAPPGAPPPASPYGAPPAPYGAPPGQFGSQPGQPGQPGPMGQPGQPQDFGAQVAQGFNQAGQALNQAFAPYQGGPMMGQAPGAMVPGEARPWMITLLLCLFAGGLGAHRFYTGHTVIGIVQLVTCGGLGFWALFDLIMIITGKYTDAQGRLLVKT